MSDKIKIALVSALYTFGSAFILVIATLLTKDGTIEWTISFWAGIGLAGFRAGIKAVVDAWVPTRLGGRKWQVI